MATVHLSKTALPNCNALADYDSMVTLGQMSWGAPFTIGRAAYALAEKSGPAIRSIEGILARRVPRAESCHLPTIPTKSFCYPHTGLRHGKAGFAMTRL